MPTDSPKVDINVLSTGTSRWKSDYEQHLNRQYNHDGDYTGDLVTHGNYDGPGTEASHFDEGKNIPSNKYNIYEVIEGEKLVITCSAHSNPPTSQIKWFKDDLPLKNIFLGEFHCDDSFSGDRFSFIVINIGASFC